MALAERAAQSAGKVLEPGDPAIAYYAKILKGVKSGGTLDLKELGDYQVIAPPAAKMRSHGGEDFCLQTT